MMIANKNIMVLYRSPVCRTFVYTIKINQCIKTVMGEDFVLKLEYLESHPGQGEADSGEGKVRRTQVR